ncbi:porin [uncultured Bacteroides sp.]|uniref:porin n=1 Tax=uncultured Bacteroides sp. TaxID=162156 RepID=UPI00262CE7B7|nr:porin [uncultured Bacteroides sp.]
MKRTLLWTCFLIWCTGVQAQAPLIEPKEGRTLLERFTNGGKSISSSSMNLQFYTSAAANFINGSLDEAAFKINGVRMELLGDFGKNFAYHFRQSFNKYSNPRSVDNLSSSVECAYVDWRTNPHFTLTVGKQAIQLSGYEYWVDAIRVREFSDFNNYIDCYQAGVNGAIIFSPTQRLNLQVLNNSAAKGEESFMYGFPEGMSKVKVPVLSTLNWDGYFFNRGLNLRYSASWGELADKRSILYLTAGNVWEKGPIVAYADFMYSREGIDTKGLISELSATLSDGGVTAQHVHYFTTILNFDYRVQKHWNVYAKGAYEWGGVYKKNGPYEKGLYRRTWNAQLCAEYFPMDNSELRIYLHLLYKDHGLTPRAHALGANDYTSQRISLGLVYTIPVF